MGEWDQPQRNDLEKGGVLVEGRMLHLGTNKTAAPVQIGFRAPVYYPVLSKEKNILPPILSPCHLLLLWGLNSQFLVLAEKTVVSQVCNANQTAAAISSVPSSGWTPNLHLHTQLKFRHSFSDCYSFLLVPVPAKFSPNSASPFLLLGYLSPIPLHWKCFTPYELTFVPFPSCYFLFTGFVYISLKDSNSRVGFGAGFHYLLNIGITIFMNRIISLNVTLSLLENTLPR